MWAQKRTKMYEKLYKNKTFVKIVICAIMEIDRVSNEVVATGKVVGKNHSSL